MMENGIILQHVPYSVCALSDGVRLTEPSAREILERTPQIFYIETYNVGLAYTTFDLLTFI